MQCSAMFLPFQDFQAQPSTTCLHSVKISSTQHAFIAGVAAHALWQTWKVVEGTLRLRLAGSILPDLRNQIGQVNLATVAPVTYLISRWVPSNMVESYNSEPSIAINSLVIFPVSLDLHGAAVVVSPVPL